MTDTSRELGTSSLESDSNPDQGASTMYSTTDVAPSSFLDRTLRGAWQAIAGVARGKSVEIRPELPDDDVQRLREQILECLEAKGGEVSARARAANLGRTYLSLTSAGRRRFLGVLARDVNVQSEPVDEAVAALQQAPDGEARARAQRNLRAALRSPRLTLYRQFTSLPQGVKFLVDLRAELLKFRREDSALEVLEEELKSLLVSWFDIGFLDLQRIEWDSPASLLEKLIHYEAVHRIRGWDDLKNRLGSDRRCFAFFHPRMPHEPLIFVEVALVKGMSGNIQSLLDSSAPVIDPAMADTAIFYSISNAQAGLKGISFGDFLIKRVVDLLAAEFKNLKTFATLSPIPDFSKWLMAKLDAGAGEDLLTPSERKKLGSRLSALGDAETIRALLYEPGWHDELEICAALEHPLLRLGAQYLLTEKRDQRFASNPVAHFHLSNGARIERLNWLADTSSNGLRQSAGVMVNYLYKLNEIEANHESYKGDGKIKASSTVRALQKNAK